jgi:hypothetical protein
MSDIVVTVPKNFRYPPAVGKKGLAAWIAEGDAAGTEWSGTEWAYSLGGPRPPVKPGERVYIVCENRLRGYAPLVRLEGWTERFPRSGDLIRGGGAVAVTIPEKIRGFRGYRVRWWKREDEMPFPDWMADAEPKPRYCKCKAPLKDDERKCVKCKGKTKKKRRDRIAEFFARPECEEVYLQFLDWWQVMVKDKLAEHDEWPAEFCWDIWHFCRHDMWVADPNNAEGCHPSKAHDCLTDALRRRLNESRGWTNGSGPVKLRALFAKDDKDRYKIAEQYSAALNAFRDEERSKRAAEEAARRRREKQGTRPVYDLDFKHNEVVRDRAEGWYGRVKKTGQPLSEAERKVWDNKHDRWKVDTVGFIRWARDMEPAAPEDIYVAYPGHQMETRDLAAVPPATAAEKLREWAKLNGKVVSLMDYATKLRPAWRRAAREATAKAGKAAESPTPA